MTCAVFRDFRWLLWFSLLALASIPASAADIRLFKANPEEILKPYTFPGSIVVIEGSIQDGDYDAFLKIAKEGQGKVSTVYIFSAGGDFYEAMKIGRAIRALELTSNVPVMSQDGLPVCDDGGFGMHPMPNDLRNCTAASAAFFIHIGGVWRGGNYLVVHRPYFGKGKFGNLPQAKAMKAFDELQESAKTYMSEMGVPKHIQDDVSGTPSDKGLILDKKTIKTYFLGAIPYQHEWMLNRCTQLTGDEVERLKTYKPIVKANGTEWPRALGSSDTQDYLFIIKKQAGWYSCAAAMRKQAISEAYQKFFASKSVRENTK